MNTNKKLNICSRQERLAKDSLKNNKKRSIAQHLRLPISIAIQEEQPSTLIKLVLYHLRFDVFASVFSYPRIQLCLS
jgi:hypothetical protein